MKSIMYFLLIFILLANIGYAIENPQIVTDFKVNIIQSGKIYLTGKINYLEANISIPQNDAFQTRESVEANVDDYKILKDIYENDILKMTWKNPTDNVRFEVKSTVSVKKRTKTNEKFNDIYLKPTKLVQASDKEIVDLAINHSYGKIDFEKIASLTSWVHDSIKYDISYVEKELTAKEILEEGKGVCSHYSNLLLSLTRSLGYPSKAILGWVYSGQELSYTKKSEFQPHNWAEINVDSEAISVDPAWSEAGVVDATHIKFAEYPDSVWKEVMAISQGSGEIDITIDKISTKIDILKSIENESIVSKSKLLADEVNDGYIVVKTDLSTNECILSKIASQGCTIDGEKDFLKQIDKPESVYFCDKYSYFSIFEISETKSGMLYKCPITIAPYFGKQEILSATIGAGISGSDVKISVDKDTLIPDEKFEAKANGHLFTDFGLYGENLLNGNAPDHDFKIYAYNLGKIDEKEINVVQEKPFEISLTANDSAKLGDKVIFSIDVESLKDNQHIILKFENDERETDLNRGGLEKMEFEFSPETIDDNLIQVFASSEDYSVSVSKKLEITEEKNFFERIIEIVLNFFKTLFGD